MPRSLFKRILPIVLIASLLSGCWGRKEVNDIAIVTATGIDLSDNGLIRVTLLLAVPRLFGTTSAGGGGGESKLETSAGWIVSEKGETVMDAYRKFQGTLPRKIFFSHNRVIVIGENLAKKGVMPVLDFFERTRQSQLNSYVLVTKTEAAEVLNFKPKFEKLTSEIIKEEMKTNIGPSVRIGQFLTMVMDEGEEPYAPRISVVPSESGGFGLKDTKNLNATEGTAAFLGDRLVGWLDNEETRGLMWVRNEMKKGVITVNIPKERGGGRVSAEFSNVRSKLSPIESEGDIRMKIKLSASLNVYENTSNLDLSETKNAEILRTLFADEIKERIRLVCEKAQKTFQSDILGFGQSVYRHNHSAWKVRYAKKWRTLFPDVKVDTETSVQIVNTGLIGKDIKWEDKK
ncbi:Ger(x)C family spore germination protein [Paenibacillus alginolyticus]|uniref:Ger(X)C family spore germination protein n=1 Tax=Paenibacillus alginolyticus TaxID=59839 RepID=A0ABT4GCI5_9BACL|nr:Ger(x)C family spore germination protein [Paenibacillus alginolyticus]MCY9693834.1 Ger(x)C family spore germination protein [Paenibacillus alginolyticus]MEC0148169.1 Ger(x)C family spore germination protein [Paenibacillus alginolyticus]